MRLVESRYGIIEDMGSHDLENLQRLLAAETGFAPIRYASNQVDDPNDAVGVWQIGVVQMVGAFACGQPDLAHTRELISKDGWSPEFVDLYMQAVEHKLGFLSVEDYL
jgi:hypothetical protein